ncbi:MAG: TolC family protein, partial [Perlucidibaca sp.]
ALNASLPLFTGFQQRYQKRAASAQVTQQQIELQRVEQQVSLDVWQAWQTLNTALARVGATDSLLASAQESSRAALARYRAGLGSLLNVLNAQSSLADARQQQARARYDWAAARLQLAQASGVLVRNPENILVTPPAQEPRP